MFNIAKNVFDRSSHVIKVYNAPIKRVPENPVVTIDKEIVKLIGLLVLFTCILMYINM